MKLFKIWRRNLCASATSWLYTIVKLNGFENSRVFFVSTLSFVSFVQRKQSQKHASMRQKTINRSRKIIRLPRRTNDFRFRVFAVLCVYFFKDNRVINIQADSALGWNRAYLLLFIIIIIYNGYTIFHSVATFFNRLF